MFVGQFKPMMQSGEEEKPETTQKPPEQQKSPTAEEFVKTPEAKEFIKTWGQEFTKRGVTDLLSVLHQNPGLTSNKEVLARAEDVLKRLGNKDGLQGFLMGWKAKSEGIVKGLKSILGG